jgi:hypothetical protein
MGRDVLGGGVIVAIAAVLWLIYLVPTWSRRREYLATERNAVRLQQTLRILAETSEIPNEVRIETAAREVVARKRALRAAEAQARANTKGAIKVARNTRLTYPSRVSRARRTRQARATASLVLLFSVIATGVGCSIAATGGGLFIMFFAGALLICSLTIIVVLARVTRVIAAVPVAVPERGYGQSFIPVEFVEERVHAPRSTWTPTPLPKPLHLYPRSSAAGIMASADATQKLRNATAMTHLEAGISAMQSPVMPLQRTQLTPRECTAITLPVASSTSSCGVANRFSSMGFVDVTEPERVDLDAVLRHRRAAS